MIRMPREKIVPDEKIEGLLKQAGFPEINKINLLSVCPIPVLSISSHTMGETMQMWSEILDGKASPIREVSTAYYQCLLLGEAIGVKIITVEPDPNNPGDWKEESKVEVVVYRRVSAEKWEKLTIIPREDKQPDIISGTELGEVTKVARFIELILEEYNKGR